MEEINAVSMFDAEEEWKWARRKALYQRMVCLFKHCSLDLLSFKEVQSGLHLDQKIDRGLQEIQLNRIRGSVGRCEDFTATFLPRKNHLRQRWKMVNVAMKAGKTSPIEVYLVGGSYFVLDGNHRVSIARQQGLKTIEAYVWEFPTPHGLSPDVVMDEGLIEDEGGGYLGTLVHHARRPFADRSYWCN